MERWALQVAHFCWERDITEINSATPHLDRISPLQVHRIYQETLVQYCRIAQVPALCSDISRCRNSAPKISQWRKCLSFFPSNHHFRVVSELLAWWILDRFDALNSLVVPICPWRLRLLRYRQNRRRLSMIPTVFIPLEHHHAALSIYSQTISCGGF